MEVKIDIDPNKVIFVNLTEMNHYAGKEEDVKPGGGKYVELHKYGHELFNFLNDEGYCYGYTPPSGKVNLKRISSDICKDSAGKYVDDVFVIFTGSRRTNGRLVVGFYKNARIYETSVQNRRESRYLKDQKSYIPYNVVCKANDAVLINYENRSEPIPMAKGKGSFGFGRSPLWYADTQDCKPIKEKIIKYITAYFAYKGVDDEEKYEYFKEGETREQRTERLSRSQKAKEQCLKIKGYKCSVCGFDFEKEYGEMGKGFIEVHHIVPIAQLVTADNYVGTDPINDLIPICSNCHSMIHRKSPPYKPEDIKKAREKQSSIK